MHLWHSKLRVRDTQFSSKAYGTHDWKEISIDGRVQLDLLMAIQRDHKLSRQALRALTRMSCYQLCQLLCRAMHLLICMTHQGADRLKQGIRTSRASNRSMHTT